jgi:hypothetical protein
MRSHRLKFRKSQRSDMSALLMLTKQLYPTYGWTDEFMQWQYFNNPAGEAHIWMCFDGNNPVGSVAALPHVVRVNSQKVIGYRIQGVLTHPDYRGLSIYRRLSELCYEFLDSDNTSINFTFPNEKSDKVFRTSGWTPIGEIPLWISKPEDNNIVNLTPKYQLIRKFSSSEQDIWDLYRGQRILGIEKNLAFLNWRYFDNPNSKYHCYRIDRSNSSVVFILKKYLVSKGNLVFHLCDLFYSSFDENHLIDVLSFVHEMANAERASMVSLWLSPADQFASVIKKSNYIFSPIVTRSYFLRSKMQLTNDELSKWNIRMGDSDVY